MTRRLHIKSICFSVICVISLYSQLMACTGIMLCNEDNSVVHGRTMELPGSPEISIVVVPRGYEFTGKTPKGDGLKYTAKYAAVGAILYNDVIVQDGINETGIAAASFMFRTFAEYTPVTTENQKKGLSPADFTNWLLTQFATIDEVREAAKNESVVITPTVVKGWGTEAPPFHYIVYNNTGESIVIEPVGGKLIIHENPFGVITNSPTFDWYMTNIRNYIPLNPNNIPSLNVKGIVLKPFSVGNGMFGLPGDFTPTSRFVRAIFFSTTAIPAKTVEKGIEQVFHILNNFDIPLGSVRDKAGNVTNYDHTVFTVARDPQNLRYYYKSYDDQTLRMVQLRQFDLEAKGIKKLNAKSKQLIVDMTNKLK